ncbi:MAG: hypothetical protein ABGZ53_05070, partial [Fuerstiella sp.]
MDRTREPPTVQQQKRLISDCEKHPDGHDNEEQHAAQVPPRFAVNRAVAAAYCHCLVSGQCW